MYMFSNDIVDDTDRCITHDCGDWDACAPEDPDWSIARRARTPSPAFPRSRCSFIEAILHERANDLQMRPVWSLDRAQLNSYWLEMCMQKDPLIHSSHSRLSRAPRNMSTCTRPGPPPDLLPSRREAEG